MELAQMSTVPPQQFVDAQKAGVAAAYGLLETVFNGFEKLGDLNIQAAKTALAENQAVASQAVSVQAPQSLFELQARQAQASAEKMQAYLRHVNDIVVETRNELFSASEARVANYMRDSKTFFENLAKQAPPGTEQFVSFWRVGFGAAQQAGATSYEQAKAAAKQTLDVIDKAGKTVAKA
jgi:phasin family protein